MVIDSSVLIAMLTDEPDAADFEALIEAASVWPWSTSSKRNSPPLARAPRSSWMPFVAELTARA